MPGVSSSFHTNIARDGAERTKVGSRDMIRLRLKIWMLELKPWNLSRSAMHATGAVKHSSR
jgi:hypothetical protein